MGKVLIVSNLLGTRMSFDFGLKSLEFSHGGGNFTS